MNVFRAAASLFLLALVAGCPVPRGGIMPRAVAASDVPPQVEVSGIPTIPKSVSERMRQYANTRSAAFQDWIADGGGILISTRFGGATQIHRVDRPLGARHQLTFGKEPVSAAQWARWRGRKGFVYLQDVGGGEAHQIFHFDVDTGKRRLLTDGKSRNRWFNVSRGGRYLAYSSTRRTGRHFDLWVQDLHDGGKPRLIAKVRGYWIVLDWSQDDREILALNYVSANRSFLWRVDVASGKRTRLRPRAKHKVYYESAAYSADGRSAYYVSDEQGEFRQLALVDLASGQKRVLTGDIPWDVTSLEVDRRGRWLAFTTNENGRSKLRIWSVPDHKPVTMPRLPVGLISRLRFDQAGNRLAFTMSTSRSPADTYVLDVKAGVLRRWTRSEVGGLDTRKFVTPRLIRYPTFDRVGGKRRMIPAFYYRPPGKGPFPVVIIIHGGPESQFRPRFSAFPQYLTQDRRVALLAPNVRGSSGYGKSYLLLDNGFKREDSVKDIGALLDWIKARPELDAGRVAVVGGSYGGYMVLACMARYPNRIRAGVDVVGISNFVTFLRGTKKYRRNVRRVEYGDERDPKMRAFLQKISPTNLAHRIKSPLFVAQGLNDPRVPVGESQQIVAKVRAAGVPTWYMLARNEGHGFRKKANRDYYVSVMAYFLQRHLEGR